MNKNLVPFLIAGVLLLLAILLLIPTTSQALFSLLGIDTSGQSSVGSNFDAFIPFIPGYFPDGFLSKHVGLAFDEGPGWDQYSEFYASEMYFYKIIQTQGRDVAPVANPTLTIQGSPASLSSQVDVEALLGEDLDLSLYDTSEVWLLTVVMREIEVQVVSNQTREEVLRFADELIPQRCTKTPTPEG